MRYWPEGPRFSHRDTEIRLSRCLHVSMAGDCRRSAMPHSDSKRPTPKSTMTLDRVLSRFGLASRAEARSAILAGRLKVNRRRVRDPDLWVRPEKDVIPLGGQRVQPARKLYLAVYMPAAVVTSR